MAVAGVSVEEVSYAVGEVVGFESVKSASRINSEVLIFLDDVSKVESGAVLRETFTPVYLLVNPAKKMSNTPPFIINETCVKLCPGTDRWSEWCCRDASPRS